MIEDLEKHKEGNIVINQKLKKIDRHYISNEIQHLLHFEKGFLFTLKNLLLTPGKSIRQFLFEDRTKHIKPILFLILASFIFTLILHWLHIEFEFFNIDTIEPMKGKLRSKEIGEWTNSHIGYAQLIMGIFIAFWIKIFFRKSNYNIFEILVLLSFVLGEAFFIFGIFIILATIFKSQYLAIIGIAIYFIYIIWAIGQFFGEKKIINYLKSLLAYFLGNATYLLVLILIAYFLKFL